MSFDEFHIIIITIDWIMRDNRCIIIKVESMHDNRMYLCTGFGRVILALISFYFMPTNYVVASWCYVVSSLLDAIDGHAARYYNQSTKFGAILDQLTDRIGTMCLMVTLCLFYPAYTFWFQLSMAIDIACHWIYLHT